MGGDTIDDIQGAELAGVDCILCKWGCTDERALAKKVAATADKPTDLLLILKQELNYEVFQSCMPVHKAQLL